MRLFEGSLGAGEQIRMMHTGASFEVVQVGRMSAFGLSPVSRLYAGEVGYITASIKSVGDTRVGDTVTTVENGTAQAYPGFQKAAANGLFRRFTRQMVPNMGICVMHWKNYN